MTRAGIQAVPVEAIVRQLTTRETNVILNIYMKSGNRLRLRGVKNWKFDTRGNEVVGITIERSRFAKWFGAGERLIVSTIDMSQIEAVTVA